MTIKGGTSQACASCKFQRRRCSKDCALAPYFPADQPKIFQNAHRLYGVSKIVRILKGVHPNQKEEAMRSIIYESNMRARFPVYGCVWVIHELQVRFNRAMEELQYITSQLAIYKDQRYYQMTPPTPQPCSLRIGVSNEIASVYGENLHHHHHNHPRAAMMYPLCPHEFAGNGNNGNGIGAGDVLVELNDHNMIKRTAQKQHIYHHNSVPVQSQFRVAQGFPLQKEMMEVSHVYNDLPFDTIADDIQSFVECKEPHSSSAESKFKDTKQSTQHVTENELRTAAAYLTLTGVD